MNSLTYLFADKRNTTFQRTQKLKRTRHNQSLKLTAKAEVVSRYAQENGFVVATRRQCWTALRIVR
jgi:hypothetical protein